MVLLLLVLLLPGCKNAGDADEFQILRAFFPDRWGRTEFVCFQH